MKKQFDDVPGTYGAPMGRIDFVHREDATVTLFKVHMVDGDYDDGGAYWGGGGTPLFCARDDEGKVRWFVRTESWERARDVLLEGYPDLVVRPKEFDMDAMVQGYLECALWSSTECDEDGNDCHPLDDNYGVDDIAPEAVVSAIDDCQDFVDLATEVGVDLNAIGMEPSTIGHDFWLTRNGHGAGFWDRDLGKVGDQLTRWSKTFSGIDPYVGDDGFIYFS